MSLIDQKVERATRSVANRSSRNSDRMRAPPKRQNGGWTSSLAPHRMRGVSTWSSTDRMSNPGRNERAATS